MDRHSKNITVSTSLSVVSEGLVRVCTDWVGPKQTKHLIRSQWPPGGTPSDQPFRTEREMTTRLISFCLGPPQEGWASPWHGWRWRLTGLLFCHRWAKDKRVILVSSVERKRWLQIRPLPVKKPIPSQFEVGQLQIHLKMLLCEDVVLLGLP